MARNHVYMAVTPDEYELPLAVADTIGEMAKMFNTTYRAVNSAISKGYSGKTGGAKFIKVLLS